MNQDQIENEKPKGWTMSPDNVDANMWRSTKKSPPSQTNNFKV